MLILIKHIWRNIKEKKLMSILIIFSIALSGALLFVALSIQDVINTVDDGFETLSTIFFIIFIVISFMSIFVVYSSFKYLMALRLKTFGTFRSVGANKKSCRNILLLESLVYGIISALVASILGFVLLVVLSGLLTNGKATIIIAPINFV